MSHRVGCVGESGEEPFEVLGELDVVSASCSSASSWAAIVGSLALAQLRHPPP
jgi:hypothetical protein